jgi:hypothetical protein
MTAQPQMLTTGERTTILDEQIAANLKVLGPRWKLYERLPVEQGVLLHAAILRRKRLLGTDVVSLLVRPDGSVLREESGTQIRFIPFFLFGR